MQIYNPVKKMKILYLTYYFRPDLCAGSFRNSSLFEAVLDQIGEGDFVHVITTVPNRYGSYSVEGLKEETGKNYRIDRLTVPMHASGMAEQAKAFTSYYKGVMNLIKSEKYDMVFASSSRLFTAFLGKRCAVKNHCPLYLDIRDIFVDTMKDILMDKKYIGLGCLGAVVLVVLVLFFWIKGAYNGMVETRENAKEAFSQEAGMFMAKVRSQGSGHHFFGLSTGKPGAPMVALYHYNGDVHQMGLIDGDRTRMGDLTGVLRSMYHVYTFRWTKNEIVWYVNNLEILRLRNSLPKEAMFLLAQSFLPGKEKGGEGKLKVQWARVYRPVD